MQTLEDLMPHQLKLSKAQIAKLLQGLTASIPHKNLGSEKGEQIIHLLADNAEKLLKGFKSGGAVKMKLKPIEIAATVKHGSGLSIESIMNSPIAEKILTKLADKAVQKLVGGDFWGDAGKVFKKIAENPTTQRVAEKLAEKAIDRAISGGKLVKGSPEMKARMQKLRELRGKKGKGTYEDLLAVQKGLRTIGTPFEKTIGVNPADIGEPIGQAIGETFRQPLRKLFGLSGDGIKGKGVENSKAYQRATACVLGTKPVKPIVSNKPASAFPRDSRVKPSSDQMTLSPYLAPSAPAMNPFVPKSYKQEGGTQSGYGGKGLY